MKVEPPVNKTPIDLEDPSLGCLREIRSLLQDILVALTEKNTITKKKKAKARDTTGVGIPPIGELWNTLADRRFPRVMQRPKADLSYRQASQRMDENPKKEHWTSVIQRMNQSDYLRGLTKSRENPLGFDFMVRPGNAVRVLEGSYDNRYQPKKVNGPVVVRYKCPGCGETVLGERCLNCYP